MRWGRLAAGLACLALAAPAAGAETDDARARALADRILTAMGYDVMMENLASTLADSTVRSTLSCTPATPREDARRLGEIMEEEVAAAAPAYREQILQSYATRLTVGELEALADFYDSPEGRSVAAAAAGLVYDQFLAQYEIDRAALRAYQRMGWCDNAL